MMRYIWHRRLTPGYHVLHLTTLLLASTLGHVALHLTGMWFTWPLRGTPDHNVVHLLWFAGEHFSTCRGYELFPSTGGSCP